MSNSLLLYKYDEISLGIEDMTFFLILHSPTESDVSNAMHTHISTELFACAEGKVTVECPGKSVVLKSGELLIVPPGIPHYRSSVSDGARHITVSFLANKRNSPSGFDLYKRLSRFFSGKSAIYYKNVHFACDMLSEVLENHKRNGFGAVLRTVELLDKLTDRVSLEIAPVPTELKSEAGGKDIRRMMDLDQIINDFYSRELKLEDVAKELFISTRQLDRIVRKRYGKTLRAVIADRRIAVAEQLLITTDMNVDRISHAVGFRSKSGFYREFSLRKGMTPSDWRSNNKIL